MKLRYEKPMITDERGFEVQALACLKIPGQGAVGDSYCGTVFQGRVDHQDGCYLNPTSRSS